MEILAEYQVGTVKVTIERDDDNICRYIIHEPKLKPNEKLIVKEVLNQLPYILNQNTEEKKIEDEILKRVKEKGLSDEALEKVMYYINRQLQYGVITTLMLDPEVEEIESRGYGNPIVVIHRTFGGCIRLYTNIIPKNDNQVLKIIERLASKANKSINIARPYLEFALPEGHRVAATVRSQISIPGSTFDIRKFPEKPLSITFLIKKRALNELIAAYLWFIMEYKPFILFLGPTGAGKTTILNAVLSTVNPNYKVLTIEDTPEINVKNDNWVRFISRTTLDKSFNITLEDLAKLSLRYRPDYLVIGEVRGKEIEALIHAAASGHASLSTFHGASPHDATTRITSLLSTESPELAKLFLQTVWLFVVVGRRIEDGKSMRSILSIYETYTANKDVDFERVIEYNFTTKTFEPEEVDVLVNKSHKLKMIQEMYGLTNDDVKNEIERRANYLRKLVSENILDVEQVSSQIRKFYNIGEKNAKKQKIKARTK